MFNSACNVISHSRIYKEGLGHKFIDHHVPVTRNMASNNSSELPELATSFEVNSYLALNSCLLIFFALPGLILNGLAAVALAGELAKKQGRAQWIILLNISLAGLVTALTLGTVSTSRLLLFIQQCPRQCRVAVSCELCSISHQHCHPHCLVGTALCCGMHYYQAWPVQGEAASSHCSNSDPLGGCCAHKHTLPHTSLPI